MTNIPVKLRDIADDLMMGAPPDVILLDASDLYAYADELDAHGNKNASTLDLLRALFWKIRRPR